MHRPLTVAELAEHAGYSTRTFARRFVAEVGATPLRWLTDQRLLEARRLLEATELPIEEVAWRCGLGTAANLRLHLARDASPTPTAYRKRSAATPRRPKWDAERPMLEMRDTCERCGGTLALDGSAMICSYECTFCTTCSTRWPTSAPTARAGSSSGHHEPWPRARLTVRAEAHRPRRLTGPRRSEGYRRLSRRAEGVADCVDAEPNAWAA